MAVCGGISSGLSYREIEERKSKRLNIRGDLLPPYMIFKFILVSSMLLVSTNILKVLANSPNLHL